MSTMKQPKMPTLFVSHGAPNLVLGDLPVRSFLAGLATLVPPPRAILCISAHWLTREPTVDVSAEPRTIHDFQGFEPELYRIRYPAVGAVELAGEVADALGKAGFEVHREQRGLDHGAWVPLMLAWGEADVPVTQLSLQPGRGTEHHYRMGLALAHLRASGVLVLGSGGATHNLRELSAAAELPAHAARFDRWLDEHARAGDAQALIDYRALSADAERSHPTEDHYLPLLVALGAAGEGARGETLHESVSHGAPSLRAFSFD